MGAKWPTVGQKVRVRDGKFIERFPHFLIEAGTGVVSHSDSKDSLILVDMDDDDELAVGDESDRQDLFGSMWEGKVQFHSVANAKKDGGTLTAVEDFWDTIEAIE
jgi:hypothetical protein